MRNLDQEQLHVSFDYPKICQPSVSISHGSRSFIHNGGKEIKRDGGINPLKKR